MSNGTVRRIVTALAMVGLLAMSGPAEAGPLGRAVARSATRSAKGGMNSALTRAFKKDAKRDAKTDAKRYMSTSLKLFSRRSRAIRHGVGTGR